MSHIDETYRRIASMLTDLDDLHPQDVLGLVRRFQQGTMSRCQCLYSNLNAEQQLCVKYLMAREFATALTLIGDYMVLWQAENSLIANEQPGT